MNIVVVSGSHRESSQSLKVSKFISSIVGNDGHNVEIIDLAGNPLPLWGESIWKKDELWKERWQPISEILKSADAFVFVVPEWSGMVPSGFKNFMLLCGNIELGHKPALIVTVSAANNGTYPVAELRMSSSKNNHVVYIPDHVIVRNVESVLNSSGDTVSRIGKRLLYSLSTLYGYGECLKDFREKMDINYKEYGYGM